MERHRLERPSLRDLTSEGSYLWLSANHGTLELTASRFRRTGFQEVSNGQLFRSRESQQLHDTDLIGSPQRSSVTLPPMKDLEGSHVPCHRSRRNLLTHRTEHSRSCTADHRTVPACPAESDFSVATRSTLSCSISSAKREFRGGDLADICLVIKPQQWLR